MNYIRIDTFKAVRKDGSEYLIEIVFEKFANIREEKTELIRRLNQQLNTMDRISNPYIMAGFVIRHFYKNIQEAQPITRIPVRILKRR